MLFKPCDIADIALQLQQGAIGAFPCDTLLGIVALPTPSTIERIQTLKQRPNTPFLILLPDRSHLHRWTTPLDPAQEAFLDRIWPGPVSCILPKNPKLSPQLTAGKPGIGLRIPNFLPLNFLLSILNAPLISTSLNHHGSPPAQHIADCPQALRNTLDFTYDAIEPRYNSPSTILELTPNAPTLIRQGVQTFPCLSYD